MRQIILKHIKTPLWGESQILENLFDRDNNPKAFSQIIGEVNNFAKRKSRLVMETTGDEKAAHDLFNHVWGLMGEVLCEFWLHLFGHMYHLGAITDTSENEYTRGYDFHSMELLRSARVLIQVKMRGDETSSFNKNSLFTFFDEAEKAKANQRMTILMVPTSVLTDSEILSYKHDFKQDYLPKVTFIGQHKMVDAIQKLMDDPDPLYRNGMHEFLTRFKEAVDSYTK